MLEVQNGVRAAREQKQWTMGELAKKTGCGRSTVCEIENGSHLPRIDTALFLARALGVDVGKLFYLAEGKADANKSGNGAGRAKGHHSDSEVD